MNANGHDGKKLNYADYSILIVDDTPVNLGVIVDFLQGAGFNIRIARTGKSALKRVQYDQPDLILLDVLMPGLDGFETCRRLKENIATQDIPIIFMTSLTSVEDKVRGFEVGAVDYVTKPLHREEVLARITTHLRLHQKHENRHALNQIEKSRLFEAVSQQRRQLRALTHKLTEAQEAERKQLARELHDEMGQALTAISIDLSAAIQALDGTISSKIKARLLEANDLTVQTLEQIRELSLNLRPPMLDDVGLLPTLAWYVKRFDKRLNTQTHFEAEGWTIRLSPLIETTVYRIVQEALTNIARHAQATHIQLRLCRIPQEISLFIQDDGQGFDISQFMNAETLTQATGLLGIRERVLLLNGHFEIQSEIGQGTELVITIPWDNAYAAD